MSDYYLFNFRFAISTDAPASLLSALCTASRGGAVPRDQLSDLPLIVHDYLAGEGFPGDGVHQFNKEMDAYLLRLSRTFHDDEYFNGGIYFPYWLMSFAARDGQLGTMHQINGDTPPVILTKVGPLLHETEMAYSPDEFWPIPGQRMPDASAPLIVKKTTTHRLTELMDQLNTLRTKFGEE